MVKIKIIIIVVQCQVAAIAIELKSVCRLSFFVFNIQLRSCYLFLVSVSSNSQQRNAAAWRGEWMTKEWTVSVD